jgi:hypothetical protein
MLVTFAETAIISYHLSFADQGKKNFHFRFRLQQTNGSRHFLFAFCNKNGILNRWYHEI